MCMVQITAGNRWHSDWAVWRRLKGLRVEVRQATGKPQGRCGTLGLVTRISPPKGPHGQKEWPMTEMQTERAAWMRLWLLTPGCSQTAAAQQGGRSGIKYFHSHSLFLLPPPHPPLFFFFWCGPFLKSLLNLLHYPFFFFFFNVLVFSSTRHVGS